MKWTVIFLSFYVFFLSSCQSQITKEERQWIIKKTLNDLVFVKGGTFLMGDVGYTDNTGTHQYYSGKGSSLPVHQVTLDSYSMGKLEVTFKEFDLFCKDTGKELVGKKYRKYNDVISPELSAIWLDWYQAKAYCDWLFKLTGLNFKLATDAQWEYAARSRGKSVKYATDNGLIEQGKNYKDKKKMFIECPPPGSFPPNPLGIYDMSGGIAEWVLDAWYDYTEKPQVNPLLREGGGKMVVRGFTYIGDPSIEYSIYSRGYRDSSNTGAGIGIRFVVNQKEPVDVDAVLKRLGIPPITEEEKEAFMPKNW